MTWTAAGILAAWESASPLTPPRRMAVLLCSSGRVAEPEAALDLDVRAAAGLLLAAHADAFGRTVDLVVACDSCGSTLQAEVVLPVGEEGAGPVRVGGFEVRLPTMRELDAVHGLPDAGARLRDLCVTRIAAASGAEPTLAGLDSAVDVLAGAAAWHGTVVCPDCGAGFDARLDPGALLWDRVRLEAPRLLDEVAALASAFGWTESEILALSEARRSAYLDLVGAP